MATEITKTLDEVGGFGARDDSRLETLIPDSVASVAHVARTEENGAEDNHVDVDEDLADENRVLTVNTTTITTTEVVEIQTTVETSFQGPADEVEMEVDGDVVAAGVCENKTEQEEEEVEQEEGLASLAVDEAEVEAEVDAEGNNDLDEDSEKVVELEKMDIDLNGEEEEENKDDIDSMDGEEKEGYIIGDLVWGKIRSHPWWPGQIYDPLDASDYAKKQKSSGHLVAYFGDGSFSWCSLSQLRHIEEDFDEKSRQSNNKNFTTAVENALNEVIRLAKLKMTCSCIPVEPERQSVENAGIKQGVLVPDHGISLLKTVGFESHELLENIKSIAKFSSAKNRLEVATITGLLSAFNRAKGGHRLAVYNDTCYIDGLEDKKKKDVKKVVLSHLNIPDEIVSDEEFSSLKKKKGGESSIDLHQRKKKSVADLLKESKTVETDDYQTPTLTTKKLKSEKKSKTASESSHKRTKTKINENNENNEKGGDEENVEIVHTPRERKRSKYLSPPYTNPNAFFSKRDFRSDSVEAAKIEPVMNSSESSAKTNSPVTSDSFSIESNETAKEVLSVLKSAALNPLDLKKKNPLGITKGILRLFREAYYLNGSTYKEYHQSQRVGKKRNLDNSRASLGKKKLKACGEDKAKEEKAKPKLLMATFPPGFSLPSKDKIIGMFSKFGLLNEMLTEVSYNSYCARIAFVNSSDAEEAFKACSLGEEKGNPFGDDAAGKVKYRLELATGTEVDAKPRTKNDEDKNRFVFIKKKLEKMASMLEKCDGSLSGERKKKLEDEMKGLLGKVSEMF
ncbi:PWWP domain-containing protein 6 [Impatiens glandulifera]|uniref:PWWP domain-containing protein 6 n=1 Tax=Impatiens glandulifera TaxID=253017 RepID=UPI001FB18B64|nr:PWWP domain-containing protein 6 [Impatiens glandulifera]